MNFSQFLKKIRSKPRETRILILWSIIVPLGIILFFWWINIAQRSISNISNKVVFPEIKTEEFLPEKNQKDFEKIKLFFNEEEMIKIMEKIENDEEFKKFMEELKENEEFKKFMEEAEKNEKIEGEKKEEREEEGEGEK